MPDLIREITGSPFAWRDVSDRGMIRVTGRDRIGFVNGLVTNDVESLAVDTWCYAALLDRKGHVLADLFVIARPDALLLDVAPGRAETVREVLDNHLIADDVELCDAEPGARQVAFEGAGVRELGQARGWACPGEGQAMDGPDGVLYVGGGILLREGIRIHGPEQAIAEIVAASNAPRIDDEAAEILRVEGRLPRYGVDVSERNFPQEARLDAALSFTKGCYLGQEIIARIRARGAVNKLLVKLETREMVSPGAPISRAAKSVGQVTSVALSPVSGPLALGYVAVGSAEPGTELDVEGVAACVVPGPDEA